jgi:hypothetical protein
LSSSLSRRRQESGLRPRKPTPNIVATVLSLLVLAALVTAVAFLVLRIIPTAMDTANSTEPAGTTIAAPAEQAAPPTPIPTVASELSAPGFHGQAPAVAMLPTVAVPQEVPAAEAPPTPTPRVVLLPTAVPTILPSPATLPPSRPVSSQPIVAQAPEAAPPAPLPVTAAQPAEIQAEPPPVVVQPAAVQPVASDAAPTAASSSRGNLQRAREMQTSRVRRGPNRASQAVDKTPVVPSSVASDEPVVTMPDLPTGGAIQSAPDTSVSVPDVNAIRDDVNARINAPRP